MKNILVTGGAGYIGSHTCVELLEKNYEVSILDNFSNSSKTSVRRVMNITNKEIDLIEGDLRNSETLNSLFSLKNFDAVIHFGALKSVEDSVNEPRKYYDNNVGGTINLIKSMNKYDVKTMVFSSSATVYGDPEVLPIPETSPLGKAKNPYGSTKQIIENLLSDVFNSDPEWSIISLRYFNPVGAHCSGMIGEHPLGKPSNLMPILCDVASGQKKFLEIFGKNYDTQDGTGVRDYIHVMDLARGHIGALEKILEEKNHLTINLGTGLGYSVLDILNAFEESSGIKIPYKFADPRPGDVAECYADVALAEKILNWRAEKDLLEMCKDAWNWKVSNPSGFDG